jgi:hypothetical protein
MRWLPLLAVGLVGCPAPKQFSIERPGLDCNRATRVAYRTMNQLGYTVTDLVPATPERPGLVVGTKPATDGTITGRVRIQCDARGAVLQPLEEDLIPTYDFSRSFDYSFKSLIQRPDVETPIAAKGLQVLVHAIGVHEALLDLGGAPTVGDAVPVRITVRNNTDRAVAIDPAEFELVTAAGSTATPLAGAALSAAVAAGAAGDKVRAEKLEKKRVSPNSIVTGFLVYPPGVYREARLSITDVETDESEGFVAPVQ